MTTAPDSARTLDSLADLLKRFEGAQFEPVEIHAVYESIVRFPACRLLVFGAGQDSALWCLLNRSGRTVFLENDEHWVSMVSRRHPSIDCRLVRYFHNILDWQALLDRPEDLEMALPRDILDTAWDVVLVDGPAGYELDRTFPGRMSSIYIASKLVDEDGAVFVHDAERQVESAYCASFLGRNNLAGSIVGRERLEKYQLWRRQAPVTRPVVNQRKHDVISSWNDVLYEGYVVLSVKPTILIYTGTYQDYPDTFVPPPPADLRPDVVIEMLSWWMSPEFAVRIAERYERGADGINRMLMTNAADEDRTRREHGIDGFHCNKEIFALEHVFKPQPRVKRYNAIYVARLDPLKRHELARRVRHLRLLTGGKGRSDFRAGLTSIGSADMAALGLHPTVSGSLDSLDPFAVAAQINESVCGLALSPVEGMMRASLQYLLCGIPVVSTHSRGGREAYYDELTAILVPDDEEAVWEAVKTLAADRRNPGEIRRRTVDRLNRYRYEFSRHVSRIRVRFGGDFVPPERIFHDLFFGEHPYLLRYIGGAEKAGHDLQRFSYSTTAPDRFRLDADRFRLSRTPPDFSFVPKHDGIRKARISDTAAWILGRLDGEVPIGDVIGELEAQFPRVPELADDVRDVIGQFLDLGALDLAWATD
ncbi:MAG: hypothetical protein U5R46_00855 [Gammaproteobacteria bacterium]|nr:hypothetical protein [Gammaproteobacteria bacterium]